MLTPFFSRQNTDCVKERRQGQAQSITPYKILANIKGKQTFRNLKKKKENMVSNEDSNPETLN